MKNNISEIKTILDLCKAGKVIECNIDGKWETVEDLTELLHKIAMEFEIRISGSNLILNKNQEVWIKYENMTYVPWESYTEIESLDTNIYSKTDGLKSSIRIFWNNYNPKNDFEEKKFFLLLFNNYKFMDGSPCGKWNSLIEKAIQERISFKVYLYNNMKTKIQHVLENEHVKLGTSCIFRCEGSSIFECEGGHIYRGNFNRIDKMKDAEFISHDLVEFYT